MSSSSTPRHPSARGVAGSAGRLAWLVSLAATLAAGVAASGSSAGEAVRAGAGDKVIVATSGIRSETRETVQITRKPKDRVVMSMSPRRLPDLVSGDRLDVTSELQVTLDCARQEPRCSGRPYEYDVNLAVKLVLARGAEATGGGNAVRLTREKRHVCLGRYPHREHHCVITFTGGGMRIGAESSSNSALCCSSRCRWSSARS